MLIKPLLAVLFALGVTFYFAKLRTRIWDRMIVLGFAFACLVLVARPELANLLAHLFGVGRGVDFLFYLAFPGVCFFCLLLYTKLTRLQGTLTLLARDLALLRQQIDSNER